MRLCLCTREKRCSTAPCGSLCKAQCDMLQRPVLEQHVMHELKLLKGQFVLNYSMVIS